MPSNPALKKPADRKPKAKPATNKYQATTWGGEALEDLTTPSGQLCQVRRVGVAGLIQAGIISSLDGLTGIVQTELIDTVEGKPKVDTAKVLQNPQALENIMHVVDRIVTHVVVQPDVEMAPNDVTRREPGVIYTDMVDLEDKMFIFQFAVGGTADFEQFRSQSQEALGDVDDREDAAGHSV